MKYLLIEKVKINFKILVFGGFKLTNYVSFLEDYFKIGREVAVYSSFEDLLLKIRYYLENESIRSKIAYKGYKKTIQEHTYLHRLKKIFNELETNL